jgi:hypothetical protein
MPTERKWWRISKVLQAVLGLILIKEDRIDYPRTIIGLNPLDCEEHSLKVTSIQEEGMSRTVAELKQLALFEKQSFHRIVTTEVYQTLEGALSICKLHDNYHDMELALLVDPKTYIIKDIDVVMNRHPFESCVQSFSSYKRLIGLRVMGGGVLHKIHQLIPRVDGCTHMYTALEASLRALFIGAGYEGLRGRTTLTSRSDHQEQLRVHPLTRETCVSFRNDGCLPEPPEVFLSKHTTIAPDPNL